MKRRYQGLFRGFLFLLVILWAWAIWAATNSPPASTNEPSILVRKVEQLESYSLSFKLDEIPALRDHSLLGEPLWKYVASLLYIVLAFAVAKVIDVVTNVWLKKVASRT